MVKLGQILVYTIHYTNTKTETVTATITDTIPEHTIYQANSADQGGVYADGMLTWNVEVESGQTVTVSFKVMVDKVPAVTLRNKAQVQEGENLVETNEVTNPTDPRDPTNPKTGDSSQPILVLTVFGISALGIVVLLAVLVLSKKRKHT